MKLAQQAKRPPRPAFRSRILDQKKLETRLSYSLKRGAEAFQPHM